MLNKTTLLTILLGSTFISSPALSAYDLTADDMGTSKNIKWTEVSAEGENVIKVELSEGVTKYFHYEYVQPEGRNVYDSQQTSLDSNGVNADFKDIVSSGIGGAIKVSSGSHVGNINGDFINNSSSSSAGAIYISGGASIGDVIGDAVGNHTVGYGGAVRNDGTVKSFEGNYVGNYAEGGTACGGGIYLTSSNTGPISSADHIIGKFIANHLKQTAANGYSKGGGLDLWRYDVGTIKADFINNTVNAVNIGYGAALNIGNSQIDNLSGYFINNKTVSQKTAGAALYMYANPEDDGSVTHKSIIKNLQGIFINNGTEGNKDDSDYIGATGGAIYNYNGEIGSIKNSLFANNYAYNKSGAGAAWGGAIYNRGATAAIGDIEADFSGNYAKSNGDTSGGAILNAQAKIGFIKGNFDNNRAVSLNSYSNGGAIYNASASIKGISGNFVNNYAEGNRDDSRYIGAMGGAIFNNGEIGSIKGGSFVNNYAYNKSGASAAWGGAIYNRGATAAIGDIEADFGGNYAKSNGDTSGGAILNYGTSSAQAKIGFIKGNFDNNRAVSLNSYSNGGAIYNVSASIKGISGNFVNNYDEGNQDDTRYIGAMGGAIFNNGEINSIKGGSFVNNYAYNKSGASAAQGGAVYNFGTAAVIGDIEADFIGNYAKSSEGGARGGAISNRATMGKIINSSFINNYVSGTKAQGGAIYASSDINIVADKGESLFSGNYAETNGVKTSNAIYMSGADLNLSSINNGTITFDDGIDGTNYNINIKTDDSSVIKFNNTVDNVNKLSFGKASVVHLGLNSLINAQDMSLAASSHISTNSLSSPIITVDVEVDKAQNKVNSGKINLSGDVSGDYRILVNSLNPDVLNNLDDAIVPFLTALNDDANTASSFNIARVIGSPYLWDGAVNVKGEESGSTWYLNLTDTPNPNYDRRLVTPEVIAGIGLHEASIEQTRSVARNVSGKVASGREYCPGCGIYPTSWDSKALRNVWVMAQGESANIDKPADMDAKIWGAEGGFDLQNDVNNTLGVFASYRKGEYDLSGKGSKYYSKLGSEIDIDSYLAGLYYRYDKNMNWLFATVYGGVQQADVKTDDGMSKFDSDGVELGAGLEAGHSFALSKSLTLDPSLGVYYTQISFDKAHDNVGKSYKWDDIKHVEAEAAVKLSQQFENAKVYVKPSLIQTYTDGDSVKISGLNKADTYHDQTLGRIEIGGNYGFTDSLNGYVWSNYTYGSSYDSTAAGLGINYAW